MDWIWEGDAAEVADLVARRILLEEDETNQAMPDILGEVDISEFSIDIPGEAMISDITVGVRLAHTYAADLEVSLIHPDGTEVQLAYRNGGSSNNFGGGAETCDGELALFSDNSEHSISERAAPFVGPSRPIQPLSILEGKQAQGTWRLKVRDDWDQDEGAFFCFQMQIGSATDANYVISNGVRLGDETVSWVVPDPVPYSLEGFYLMGFVDSSLGEAWSPCCVELVDSTPGSVASAPVSPVAVAGSNGVLVSWVASVDDGGSAVTGYTVVASPGGAGCVTAATSCQVTGLTNGTEYTFTVIATNDVGDSEPSSGVTATPVPVGGPFLCFGSPATIYAVPGVVTVGTSGADVIVGTSGADVIRGWGGADKICSMGGNDRVFGGGGNDKIKLGGGHDFAKGGSGKDTIYGERGRDRIYGGGGADVLKGGWGDDGLNGGTGADRCYGGRGIDTGTRCETRISLD